MQTVKHYIWQIMPAGTPLFKKKCSKCKSVNYFYCSDKFRMNSQKRSLDVWLIYRCEKCDNTHNVTILSRTKPELIDRELYGKFSMNDEETAWKYAFDAETMRRNNIETDHSRIEYEITGQDITLENIISMSEDQIRITIKTGFNLEMKLTSLIRKCFGISLNTLDDLLSSGALSFSPSIPAKKARLKDGMEIIISRERLKKCITGNE